MQNLHNKKVLVTGAAGGLGAALISNLLIEGVRVAALVRDEMSATSLTAHDNLEIIIADLNNSADLAKAVTDNINTTGPVYGLVNNAAIYPKAKITALKRDDLATVLEVNAIAAASLVRLCVPSMREVGKGRVLNITSNTFDMGMQELSAYVGSKGALIGMSRVWARELGPWNITVNCISPGAFQTDAEKIHTDPESYDAFVLSQQALKRRGKPQEFANLVQFLLSNKAAFITGQTIRIDGGWITQ